MWAEQASGGISQHCLGYESDPDSSPSCGFPVTRTCLFPLILALLCALKEKEPELSSVAYSATGLQQDIQHPKEQTCFCFLLLQTQVAVWGLRCRQPMASCPPKSQAGGDPGVVNCTPTQRGSRAPSWLWVPGKRPSKRISGTVKLSQLCVCGQLASNESNALS